MKLVERKEYLDLLKESVQTPDIKVITGIRRSGKSKLMETFIEYVKNSVKNANIIHINFNDISFENLTEYHALNSYVQEKFDSNCENFLFIDEIQLCEGFEKTINSLHDSEKFHIYITGSNAFLLSSDLATLFTGRTYEIPVFPFPFKEYCKYFKGL